MCIPCICISLRARIASGLRMPLQGTLPRNFTNFEAIQVFDVWRNNIHGTKGIPALLCAMCWVQMLIAPHASTVPPEYATWTAPLEIM